MENIANFIFAYPAALPIIGMVGLAVALFIATRAKQKPVSLNEHIVLRNDAEENPAEEPDYLVLYDQAVANAIEAVCTAAWSYFEHEAKQFFAWTPGLKSFSFLVPYPEGALCEHRVGLPEEVMLDTVYKSLDEDLCDDCTPFEHEEIEEELREFLDSFGGNLFMEAFEPGEIMVVYPDGMFALDEDNAGSDTDN